jgi:HemX protein
VWLGYITALLYIASLALYLRKLFGEGKVAAQGWATALLALALVAHYFALLERAFALRTVPYQDLYGSMSLFAWFLGITYLGLEMLHRERAMGAFVLPLVLLLFGLGLLLTPAAPPPAPAHGSLFALHVTSNMLAYSAFTLSFVFSVIYLLQNRLLRSRQSGGMLWRLPALEDLERMSRSGVIVGLVALALGMGFGMAVVPRVPGHFSDLDPKVLISFVVLACYGIYLWLSRSPAWRGARASVVCLLSYFAVVFSYTVVNLYLSRFHRYY